MLLGEGLEDVSISEDKVRFCRDGERLTPCVACFEDMAVREESFFDGLIGVCITSQSDGGALILLVAEFLLQEVRGVLFDEEDTFEVASC